MKNAVFLLVAVLLLLLEFLLEGESSGHSAVQH
jgi:hypothetical protein